MKLSDLMPDASRIRGRSSRIFAVGMLSLTTVLAPPYVMAADDTGKPGGTAQIAKETQQNAKASQKPSTVSPADKAPNDLQSCKRDAEGMKGPERSRFMTSCLRERK